MFGDKPRRLYNIRIALSCISAGLKVIIITIIKNISNEALKKQ